MLLPAMMPPAELTSGTAKTVRRTRRGLAPSTRRMPDCAAATLHGDGHDAYRPAAEKTSATSRTLPNGRHPTAVGGNIAESVRLNAPRPPRFTGLTCAVYNHIVM